MNDPSQARQATAEAHDKITDSQQKLQESKDRAVSAASDAVDTARDVAQQKVSEARGTIEAKASEIRGTVESKAAELRGTVESKAYEARDEAKDRAETGIDDAASGLKNTAERLRGVSADLDEKDRWLGATLEQAASVAERTGQYLSGQSLNDVVGDAQRVARRNPAAFMGGAAALGFALSRLGKVTVERADRHAPDTGASRAYGGAEMGSNGGVARPATHAGTDKNRTTATGATHATPSPAGMTAGTVAPAAAHPVTRPTDGRDLDPLKSTPMHRSQA